MKADKKYQDIFDSEQAKRNEKLREELILKYAPLVKYIADRMAMRLPPHISKEDLKSAGTVGLLDALEKFDSELGIKFQTYAEHRIRGAILDELRKMDWIPRSVRKDTHRIENALTSMRSKLGREPEDFEVAEEMEMDIESYHRILSRAQGVGLLSLDMIMPDGSTSEFTGKSSERPSPFDELRRKEMKKVVAQALSKLPNKEQIVMSLYYYDELTLKEIAKVLGLTESRISQIHSKVVLGLRAKLRAYFEG